MFLTLILLNHMLNTFFCSGILFIIVPDPKYIYLSSLTCARVYASGGDSGVLNIPTL